MVISEQQPILVSVLSGIVDALRYVPVFVLIGHRIMGGYILTYYFSLPLRLELYRMDTQFSC